MELEIDLNKSVEENAGIYYNAAKKAKKKLEGARKALEESRCKLQQLQQQEQKFWEEEKKKETARLTARKKEWYEKFHWFISSEGFLCIGGRDATSNEIIIKKHLEKGDLVFHAEAPGSPFFIVKKGQQATEKTLLEAAQATAVYSAAWKLGRTMAEVFYVLPEQISKEAKAGEYLQKGSFMIYGRKNTLHPAVEYAFGIVEGQIIGAPLAAVESKVQAFLIVVPGDEKKSSLAKRIKAKLKGGDIDEIVSLLPAGGGEIKSIKYAGKGI